MDSERLSAALEDKHVQDTSQPSILGTTDRARVLMVETDEHYVRLNGSKVDKENLERKVPGQDVIIKAMTGFVKQLQRKVSLL